MSGDQVAVDLMASDSLLRLARMLAVAGRLGASGPSSPSADEILEAIRERRTAKIKAKELRRKKPLPAIPDEVPFTLPSGWKWTRLGDVCYEVADGPHFSPNWVPADHPEAVPMLSAGDISSGRLEFAKAKYVSREDHETFCQRIRPMRGDVLYTKGGTTGVAVVNDVATEFSVWVHVAVLRTDLEFVDPDYLALALNSPLCYEQSQDFTHGTGNRDLGLTRMVLILFPLPPLHVQRRVVEEFRLLKGRLEELGRHEELAAAACEKARASCLRALVKHGEWDRVRDNWNALFTTPDSVDDLRRAILNLAVRGMLVEQRGEDGEATSLLAEVRDARQRLVSSGELKRQKSPLELPDALPHAIPKNWAWARLVDCIWIESNLTDPKDFPDSPHVAPDSIEKGTGRLLPYRTIREDGVTSGKHRFFPGQILYSKIRPNLSKAVLVDFEGLCSADMYPLRTPLDGRWALSYILSPVFVDQVVLDDNRVAMPKVNQEQLSQVLIAVPPLAEQHRIVAKVDELMALCDDLEARLKEVEEISEKLAESVVSHVAV